MRLSPPCFPQGRRWREGEISREAPPRSWVREEREEKGERREERGEQRGEKREERGERREERERERGEFLRREGGGVCQPIRGILL